MGKKNIQSLADIKEELDDFIEFFEPIEKDNVIILEDNATGALYWECHIYADRLLSLGTIDAPLDPDQQPEYRANRELIQDSSAYAKMIEDAQSGRTFSNIVAEYNVSFNEHSPLKIIGGQHRYMAIQEAYNIGINEIHGIKVYFGLSIEQRLDVQLISNTNIDVSSDLLDRMYETVKGPQLRSWCQEVGLLEKDEDFADRRVKGVITVRGARTFIMNYYAGVLVNDKLFEKKKTIPVLAKTGGLDNDWEELKATHPNMWEDTKLVEAGKQFVRLKNKQNEYFNNTDKKEYSDKAYTYSIIGAWAYIAGVLNKNEVRLIRHYSLPDVSSRDPLNAAVLAQAKHGTDPENYRGLGTRTDVKDRGRLAELFFLQADKGEGIKKNIVDLAIKKYHAKLAVLEVIEAESKL